MTDFEMEYWTSRPGIATTTWRLTGMMVPSGVVKLPRARSARLFARRRRKIFRGFNLFSAISLQFHRPFHRTLIVLALGIPPFSRIFTVL